MERMRRQLEQQARQAFLEIEQLVLSHREANAVPTLGASDILDSASLLVNAVVRLRNHGWLEDAPKLEPTKDLDIAVN